MEFTKAEVQDFKNMGLSHNAIAPNLEDQTRLKMMDSPDVVQINFLWNMFTKKSVYTSMV